MRVMKQEYIPDKYTKAENRIINEYFTRSWNLKCISQGNNG